ncbi:peptide transporter PTR2B [Collybia nuda]|uniref:Peptide transporter PTR2B n=1 Tax=Collybia nuda TaxID=64659 RepID=A0A9P5Y9F0_9AGAR|nr:peptide transporter PTR2B [Collybia nuda]
MGCAFIENSPCSYPPHIRSHLPNPCTSRLPSRNVPLFAMASYPTEKSEKESAHASSISNEKLDYQGEPDGSSIVEGSEGVTEHELLTLRHVADRLPYTSWLVVIVEFAERWTYYGTTNIYNNYIQFKLPPGSDNGSVPPGLRGGDTVAGALGRGQQKAFAIRTFNSFWVYITPWVGGILADTLWGRYKTILIFSIVCLIGHVILVASSSPAALANSNTALGLLVLSIVVMGLGAGAIKANVSPMIAEQYTGKLRKETLPSGEVVIKSPAVTIQSMYLWFYAAINFGSCGAISASFLARDNGYWVAFLVPTCIFVLVPLVLIVGRKNYVVTPPRGSILLETMRVIGFALASHWSINPMRTIRAIRAPDFWDPARPSSYEAGKIPAKMTWDDEFVGEVGRTLNACSVFLFFPVFWLCYSQIDGNLGTVAAGMTLNGTPNDLIQNLNPISIIIMIPIFDRLIYPFLRSRGINFSPIKRIYAGFLVAGLAMVYSAVLEHYIQQSSPCHDGEPAACEIDGLHVASPLNVWIVAGPYILVGMAEIFASITSLEYAFTKAPKRMKSVVMAFSQFQTALSSALNFALTAVNIEQKFVWLFGSFAVTAWIVGTIFFITFRGLDRREAELNAIGQGDRAGFKGEAKELTTNPGAVKSS